VVLDVDRVVGEEIAVCVPVVGVLRRARLTPRALDLVARERLQKVYRIVR
jgi:hypothetical protein